MVPMNARSPHLGQHVLHRPVLDWYDDNARDLPWRRPDAAPWAVMVSEFMLQQTPVTRVLPVYDSGSSAGRRPADLAAEPPGEAVRAWGRLGYPRRALRLHARRGRHNRNGTAARCPPSTRAARAARHRRLHRRRGRVVRLRAAARRAGHQRPPRPGPRGRAACEFPAAVSTAAERELAPDAAARGRADAARWAVAVMELGALVCTARTRRCDACPIADAVRLAAAGQPGVRRAAAPGPDLRRHRPAGARPAARRAARSRGPVPAARARRGLGRRRTARPRPRQPARRRPRHRDRQRPPLLPPT